MTSRRSKITTNPSEPSRSGLLEHGRAHPDRRRGSRRSNRPRGYASRDKGSSAAKTSSGSQPDRRALSISRAPSTSTRPARSRARLSRSRGPWHRAGSALVALAARRGPRSSLTACARDRSVEPPDDPVGATHRAHRPDILRCHVRARHTPVGMTLGVRPGCSRAQFAPCSMSLAEGSDPQLGDRLVVATRAIDEHDDHAAPSQTPVKSRLACPSFIARVVFQVPSARRCAT